MPCDRCGGAIETYELDGRNAQSCRECGYVDVPVRHEPERGDSESWDDAISRFQKRFADVTVSETDLPGEEPAVEDPSDQPTDTSEEASSGEPLEEASSATDD
jgi:hypothetical protein